MSEPLKPCPFCGNKNLAQFPVKGVDGSSGLMIECLSERCGVHPHISYIPPDAAVRWWNTRATKEGM